MNLINILNLMFYLTPFLVMFIDHFAYKIPSRIQQLVFILFCCTMGGAFGYTLLMPLTLLFNYIPSYLFCYYSGTFFVTGILHNILNRSYQLRSITQSFLIVYFSSFFWEIPENIYWQIKGGLKPVILAFCILSWYSFIYLQNTVGWKKTRANYILLITSWMITIIGVFTLPSSVYCRWLPYLHPCAIYFVFCRVVALAVLIKIFIIDHYLPPVFYQIIQEGSFFTYVKWVLLYILRLENWRLGTEMAYWDFEINHNRPEGWVMVDICEEISDLVKMIPPPVKVLELGPGPRSRLTTGYDKGLYDLVAIDPLANDFKTHLGGRDFLVQGTGEDMYKQFDRESFDIAYASNVLDHVSNPQLCMNHLVYLTKIGGYIIIQGNTNEGTRTDWQGIHKHDIWVDGENLMCKLQHGKQFKLNIGPIEKVSSRSEKLEYHPSFSILYRRTDS